MYVTCKTDLSNFLYCYNFFSITNLLFMTFWGQARSYLVFSFLLDSFNTQCHFLYQRFNFEIITILSWLLQKTFKTTLLVFNLFLYLISAFFFSIAWKVVVNHFDEALFKHLIWSLRINLVQHMFFIKSLCLYLISTKYIIFRQ